MRFLKKIQSNELQNEFHPEQFISITLPNTIVDLHTFKFYFTGTTTHYNRSINDDYIKRFFPRLSASVIDELEISINGETKQYIREYGYLYNIINDIINEKDDIQGSSFDTTIEHRINNDGNIIKSCKIQAGNNLYQTDTFFINKWLGFLNEGNQYLDCTNKNVMIKIKLAPANILYNGINTIEVPYVEQERYPQNYTISNVYATIDAVDNAIIQSVFSFKDYTTFKGGFNENSKSCIMNFTTNKPVLWIMGTFTNPDRLNESELILEHTNTDNAKYGELIQDALFDIDDINAYTPLELSYNYDVSKNNKDGYLLNNSIYFDRSGVNIDNCKWSINNFDLTPKLSIEACFNETKQVFNSDYNKVISLSSFESNFFANAIRVEDMTDDIKHISWEVNNNPFKFDVGGTPIVFICSVVNL
jgi:hypothetical protein